MQERRIRIYHLPKWELLGIIQRSSSEDLPEYVEIPFGGRSLPHGAVVRSVFAEPEKDSIGVLVYHESFDVVAEGVDPPEGLPSLVISYHKIMIRHEQKEL